MALLPGDYTGRTKTALTSAAVASGFRTSPVHIPATASFKICTAGSVILLTSINVASTAGVNMWFQDSAGTKQIIMAGATTARDYKQHFYCPWDLYISTDVDITCYVYAPAKGTNVD